MLKESALTAALGGGANLVDGLPGIEKMWVVPESGRAKTIEIWRCVLHDWLRAEESLGAHHLAGDGID